MRTVNKVTLIGNVTRDPVVKTTEAGKKIAMFTIATNRYFKSGDGESKSESEFHNCVAWGNLADRIESFLVKGKLIYIEGRLKTRVIEKEDETRIYKTEVVASDLIFLNKRSDFNETETVSETTDHDEDKF
ncbi:single-stranded DNA-binding protein [Candidatus Gracilibacteria bacterium 28_42_T64]|nr:single-stranded DNA-binding protein [Candidatus Gracilibacteria bacterium 28_42_T64]